MKKCSICGELKSKSVFVKRKEHKDGHHSWCNECRAKKRRDYRTRLREKRLCIQCGVNPPARGRVRCSFCSADRKVSDQKRLEKYIHDGLCTRCGLPTEKDYKTCSSCRIKSNTRGKLRHQKFSAKVGNYYGNCCHICKLESKDYEIYECHHLNPSIKESQISLLSCKDWDSIVLPELEKCVYLCKICHARLHVGRFDNIIGAGELSLIPGKRILENAA